MNSMQGPLSSKTKIAIVTGASGNLGRAVTKKLISEGYFVIGTALPNDALTLNYPAESFESTEVDLLNQDDSQRFVESVVSRYGHIDVAVLTVGAFASGKIAETKTGDIAKQYSLNFETTYNIA
ncbi:MAG TPA: SDR family NAD(P)-dependent oxidoreductase, partial [Chitinophagaceae bacterium]|nr:SDR family NAD(P)-dependent oxidoreductase [Chitinophagaceae bacterium]